MLIKSVVMKQTTNDLLKICVKYLLVHFDNERCRQYTIIGRYVVNIKQDLVKFNVHNKMWQCNYENYYHQGKYCMPISKVLTVSIKTK